MLTEPVRHTNLPQLLYCCRCCTLLLQQQPGTRTSAVPAGSACEVGAFSLGWLENWPLNPHHCMATAARYDTVRTIQALQTTYTTQTTLVSISGAPHVHMHSCKHPSLTMAQCCVKRTSNPVHPSPFLVPLRKRGPNEHLQRAWRPRARLCRLLLLLLLRHASRRWLL